MLRSRLFEMELRKQQEEVGSARRLQVGSGERGSKIRTYNFRENRVTDHRVGVTLYNLDSILEGQLDPLHRRAGRSRRRAQSEDALD